MADPDPPAAATGTGVGGGTGGTNGYDVVVHAIDAAPWPLVAILVLILIRKQLPSLVGRVTKIGLPGGGEIDLSKALEEGKKAAEKVEAETLDPPAFAEARPIVGEKLLAFAETAPIDASLQAFRQLERELRHLGESFGLGGSRSIGSLLNQLRRNEAVPGHLVPLLWNLQEIRNAIVHTDRSVTPGDAREFIIQCGVAVDALRQVESVGQTPRP